MKELYEKQKAILDELEKGKTPGRHYQIPQRQLTSSQPQTYPRPGTHYQISQTPGTHSQISPRLGTYSQQSTASSSNNPTPIVTPVTKHRPTEGGRRTASHSTTTDHRTGRPIESKDGSGTTREQVRYIGALQKAQAEQARLGKPSSIDRLPQGRVSSTKLISAGDSTTPAYKTAKRTQTEHFMGPHRTTVRRQTALDLFPQRYS